MCSGHILKPELPSDRYMVKKKNKQINKKKKKTENQKTAPQTNNNNKKKAKGNGRSVIFFFILLLRLIITIVKITMQDIYGLNRLLAELPTGEREFASFASLH